MVNTLASRKPYCNSRRPSSSNKSCVNIISSITRNSKTSTSIINSQIRVTSNRNKRFHPLFKMLFCFIIFKPNHFIFNSTTLSRNLNGYKTVGHYLINCNSRRPSNRISSKSCVNITSFITRNNKTRASGNIIINNKISLLSTIKKKRFHPSFKDPFCFIICKPNHFIFSSTTLSRNRNGYR